MEPISADIEKELERRLEAGPYGSVDELLRRALKALDDVRAGAREALELELLEGFEGEDVEMTPSDWDGIEREAVKVLESNHHGRFTKTG
jgi:Arc/MetJ-type ribon-helix-helix transcriptional regulator